MAQNDFPYAGLIESVLPGSLADELGLAPGDELLAINGHPLRDVIDVRFYAADESLELLVRREETLTLFEVERDYEQPLGLGFAHPTFDVEIRRCNNRCRFCFVRQMPPGLRRALYVKDDDYRYSFLHGQYVTLTNLSEEDWGRIVEQGLSPLYVSVHATEPELRRRLLGNPHAPDVMDQLHRLAQAGIEVHTQLVIIPGLNDGPHLERSLVDLTPLWRAVRSVSLVPVGLTRYHKFGLRPNTIQEARLVRRQIDRWQERCLAELGVRFAYLTDEWFLLLGEPVPPLAYYDGLQLQENGLGLVRDFLDEWEAIKEMPMPLRGTTSAQPPRGRDENMLVRAARANDCHSRESGNPVTRASSERYKWPFWDEGGEGKREKVASLTWVTGTSFAPILERVAAEFAELTGLEVEVVPIVNQSLGETVTVAGLLLGADVLAGLRGRELGQVVVLPRAMFCGPDDLTLDDVSAGQIGQALGRPLLLADGMEDVVQALPKLLGSLDV